MAAAAAVTPTPTWMEIGREMGRNMAREMEMSRLDEMSRKKTAAVDKEAATLPAVETRAAAPPAAAPPAAAPPAAAPPAAAARRRKKACCKAWCAEG